MADFHCVKRKKSSTNLEREREALHLFQPPRAPCIGQRAPQSAASPSSQLPGGNEVIEAAGRDFPGSFCQDL